MKLAIWLVTILALGVLGYALWSWQQRVQERRRATEERFASFLAQAKPAVPAPAATVAVAVAVDPGLPQQKLLLESAAKAAQAGEPALAIQLYARLLVRYPQSALAAQARAAVEEQKKKFAKP